MTGKPRKRPVERPQGLSEHKSARVRSAPKGTRPQCRSRNSGLSAGARQKACGSGSQAHLPAHPVSGTAPPPRSGELSATPGQRPGPRFWPLPGPETATGGHRGGFSPDTREHPHRQPSGQVSQALPALRIVCIQDQKPRPALLVEEIGAQGDLTPQVASGMVHSGRTSLAHFG